MAAPGAQRRARVLDGARRAGGVARLVARGVLHPEIGIVEDWVQTPRLLHALADRALRGKAVLRVGG
jgi:hypothetical protein